MPEEMLQELRVGQGEGCWVATAALSPTFPAAPFLCLDGHGHLLTEGNKEGFRP